MLEICILLGYMSLSVVISMLFRKYNSGAKEFFVAQSSFGILMIIPVMFAEVTAGAGTVGTAQVGYLTGFSAIWSKTAMALGYVVCIFIINKYYFVVNRKFNVLSVPSAFQVRFDEKTRMIVMCTTVIANLILFAVQPVALAGIVAPMLGIGKFETILILGALFVITTLMGGMKGIAWMNVLHAMMMYVGLCLVAVFSIRNIGWETFTHSLPPEMFSLTQLEVGTFLAWLVSGILSMVTSSALATIIFSAKNYKTSCTGIMISAFLMIPFSFICAIIGMYAKAKFGAGVESAQVIYLTAKELGPIFVIISSMAIVAAIFSTAPTFLLFSVTSITRDLYIPLINKYATSDQQLRFSRIAIVVLGIGTVLLGSQATSILNRIMGALQIRTLPAVVLLLALLIPRLGSTAAFWSILTSSIVAVVWFGLGSPFGIEPLWPAICILLPVLFILTILSPKTPAKGYLTYKQALAEIKDEKLL